MRHAARRLSPLALALCLAPACGALALSGCTSSYKDSGGDPVAEGQRLQARAKSTVRQFRVADPTLVTYFDNAHAYAVFPVISKGAVGVGAANGEGVVFRGGEAIAYTEMTQVTAGLQLGEQTYSQVIFFEDARALRSFRSGDLEFSANASAVAAEKGSAAAADYEEGVAVFSITRAGLMFEALLGGQGFSYEPLD